MSGQNIQPSPKNDPKRQHVQLHGCPRIATIAATVERISGKLHNHYLAGLLKSAVCVASRAASDQDDRHEQRGFKPR
jgi:hypothetical protein